MNTAKGRLGVGQMVGLSIAPLSTIPVPFYLSVLFAMPGDGELTPRVQATSIIANLQIASSVIGPVMAWLLWWSRRPRWTWWGLTLPYQLLGLLIAMIVVQFVS